MHVNKFTSLFNIHSLHDIHGIMSIIYKHVIKVNIEANNVWKGHILSIAMGKEITFKIIYISTYTQLYFVTINKETYILLNLMLTICYCSQRRVCRASSVHRARCDGPGSPTVCGRRSTPRATAPPRPYTDTCPCSTRPDHRWPQPSITHNLYWHTDSGIFILFCGHLISWIDGNGHVCGHLNLWNSLIL